MSMKWKFTIKNFRNVYWHGKTHSAMYKVLFFIFYCLSFSRLCFLPSWAWVELKHKEATKRTWGIPSRLTFTLKIKEISEKIVRGTKSNLSKHDYILGLQRRNSRKSWSWFWLWSSGHAGLVAHEKVIFLDQREGRWHISRQRGDTEIRQRLGKKEMKKTTTKVLIISYQVQFWRGTQKSRQRRVFIAWGLQSKIKKHIGFVDQQWIKNKFFRWGRSFT